MRQGRLELAWAYVLFALLVLESFLLVWLVPRGVVLGALLPVLGALAVAAGLAPRVIRMVRGHRLLQESYAQELSFARLLMETVEHGLTVTDEDGRFVYVNRAYAQLLGVTPERVLGRTPYEFTVREKHAAVREAWEHPQENGGVSYRSQLRRADGQVVEVVVKGRPRWHAGRIVGNVASVVPVRAVEERQVGGPDDR
ncbi:PAS domain S-box protein [Deinococcus taeanensis]|uniref:PAS domain S-box protein n=1 Tax=Deinococcus taeanensis TaxID=2737050 RepID=UPI001CDBF711|nr:PAS domain S-box protein [Deinococcus taeanensis]UBV42263.1 PAS domain S-box protein [Deinococcus taeanensis]